MVMVFQSPSLRGSGRFRSRSLPLNITGRIVSIPFIAGQWSLRQRRKKMEAVVVVAFQSPSLRGSGRFRSSRDTMSREATRFNPLHCGAVVA